MNRPPGGVTARANPAAVQTNTALAPGVSGSVVYVEDIYVSSDTELTVTISNSVTHDVLWRQYVGARGGARFPAEFRSALSEGLDYSTSAAGNVFLLVNYRYV
jgi:hypothetical protein